MSVFHIAGQILWYSFLGLMCLGGVFEFREHQARLKNRPLHVGRRAASRAKYYRTNVATPCHVARTAPAIVAKPRSRREPVAVDPTRADVISALRNLGWNAKQSNAAYEKSKGTCFDERLKDALALMKTHNETVLIHRH